MAHHATTKSRQSHCTVPFCKAHSQKSKRVLWEEHFLVAHRESKGSARKQASRQTSKQAIKQAEPGTHIQPVKQAGNHAGQPNSQSAGKPASKQAAGRQTSAAGTQAGRQQAAQQASRSKKAIRGWLTAALAAKGKKTASQATSLMKPTSQTAAAN